VIDHPSEGVKSVETVWVSGIEYVDDEATLNLYFAPKIIPYLSQLSGNFTAYKLKHISKFKSKYGIRLYELLIQWKAIGSREITIEEFRDKFDLVDKYPSIKDLKKYVLEPALGDINEHSNMIVKMGQRKRGKRIAALQFDFNLKAEMAKKKRPSKKFIGDNAKPGESWEDAERRIIDRYNSTDNSTYITKHLK